MTIDALNENTTQVHAYAFGDENCTPESHYNGIPFSGDVAGIELRMLPPLIRDNHTLAFWPFPGRARLYCLTLVISDAANQLTGFMDLNAFPRIGKGDYLPINKTIYYWEEEDDKPGRPPSQLHVVTSIIKSKEALRETGEILSKVKDDDAYQSLVTELGSLLKDAASFNAITSLTMQAAHIVGQYLGRVDDQPIGTVINSFTRLHGDWDRLGITPITIPTRDVDFQYELIIRDQYRKELEKAGKLILPISYMPPPDGIEQMIPM